MMGSEVVMAEIPMCDFCVGEDDVIIPLPAVVDARTRMGGWAYMCNAHWVAHADGMLGTGHGQRLVLRGS
jgi:hypothetical protein